MNGRKGAAVDFGVGEGPLLFSDPYQYLALAARETSTINLGTWVTNPLTRIAPVTANSIATLNALAPGRTFLGIGTANNALRSMGNRPAKLSELDSALTITRGLLAGERVTQTWLGQEREIEFLDRNGYWYNPDELLEKTQLMREAGCDMVSVFLSNPFTAERDIADIGASILARA
jgi:alkanesulfonate monooxygenase SsuD/methylene tetrahydromethanopterin reductase-like flavin-dependent oxidoreductase (luciferase family)